MHDDKRPIAIPLPELKTMALALADELKAVASNAADGPVTGSGGGSRHRGLPEELRERFVNIRAALFQRGIFDPVLVRFDSTTVSQASMKEIAGQLETVGSALG